MFAHTSDWHLGYEQYHKFERAEDFSKAVINFSQQVLSLDQKPDFVLHSGDVFHHFRPSSMALKTAIETFSSFQKNKIPVYVIRGNHDAPISKARAKQGNYLSLLEDLGIITYLDQRSPLVWHNKDIAILGIGYFGKQTIRILEKTMNDVRKDLEDSKFKILMLHTLVRGQLEQEYDLIPEDLAAFGWDYVALGHYHIPWEQKNYRMWCPGSTEHTSSNQWDKTRTKSGICQYGSWLKVIAEYGLERESSISCELKLIRVRPKIRIDEKIQAESAHELVRKIQGIIRAKQAPRAVYSVRIQVENSPEVFPSISKTQFHKEFADALHAVMKLEFLTKNEKPVFHIDEHKYLREFATAKFTEGDLESGLKILEYLIEMASNEGKISPEDSKDVFFELLSIMFQDTEGKMPSPRIVRGENGIIRKKGGE